jgi:chorismate dehydratase
VSFLNSVPLIEGLDKDPRVEMSRDLPSRLADSLREGSIDVGLIPVVEYLRGVGETIVPGICIGSEGPVRTVKVFSRVPLEEATSIGLDRGSRSSIALLEVLLAERFGVRPEMEVVEPHPGDLFAHHQTMLVIGDRADAVVPRDLYVYDLGQLWTELTGKPFVFAVWATAPGLSEQEQETLCQVLLDASTRGQMRLRALAEREAALHAMSVESVYSYWTESIRYTLGEREIDGMRHFGVLAARHGLVPAERTVKVSK